MTASRNTILRKPQPYQLELHDAREQPGVWTIQSFSTLEALACAVWRFYDSRADNDRWVDYASYRPEITARWAQLNMRAFSGRGRPLDVLLLARWGRQLHSNDWRWSRFPGYVRRQGPVYGVHKWRGGPSSSGGKVQAARRQSQSWLPEDGEPPVRAPRRTNCLYDSWDGRPRNVERCWKSQHHGRKAWDR